MSRPPLYPHEAAEIRTIGDLRRELARDPVHRWLTRAIKVLNVLWWVAFVGFMALGFLGGCAARLP